MPDRPKKPGQKAPGASSSGNRPPDGQTTAREARLAAALRANLRRRKAAGRQVGADDSADSATAQEPSGTLHDDNDT